MAAARQSGWLAAHTLTAAGHSVVPGRLFAHSRE